MDTYVRSNITYHWKKHIGQFRSAPGLGKFQSQVLREVPPPPSIQAGSSLGCFINDTLQKKKMQYQYAPLTGVYKPDMKEFFS